MVPAVGPVPSLWRADRRKAGGNGPGMDRALAAAGQPCGIRLPHRALAPLGAGEPADAGSPTREAGRPRPVAAAVLRRDPVDQLALAFAPSPGLGHNQPPEPIDPVAGLSARLGESHAELLLRFRDLELACARVPDPIASEADAATATDFIAQCQVQIRKAETAHRREKEPFLKSGRAVDTFFKRRCDQLTAALAPAVARLKAYRDRIAAAERRRHEAAR